MKIWRYFINTLGFMTRLAPARAVPDDELFGSMPMMPLVGAVLGVVLVLLWKLGVLSGHAWVQAWLVVAADAWLTRGLHHDGLMDVFDAVTAHTSPERFWEVVKDSRCGAFGVLGLAVVLLGQLVLFHALLEARLFAALAFVFVFGRFGSVAFAYMAKHLARPGLGRLLMNGATLNGTVIAFAVTVLAGVYALPLAGLLGACALGGVVLYPLYRLADSVQGSNGDFLGASIMLCELAAALAAVAAH